MPNIDPADPLAQDVAKVSRLPSVASVLKVVADTTGLGYTLVARVTADKWVACAVHDAIGFGLGPGGTLDVATTLCSEVRDTHKTVAIDDVPSDEKYRDHQTPKMYGFQSYIAVPIFLKDGTYFGNICALDRKPSSVKDEKVQATMALFSELISSQLEVENQLLDATETVALRDEFMAVLGHDLRNPLGSVLTGAESLERVVTSDREKKTAHRIASSARRMRGLIDDLLDFTRVRLGSGLGLKLTDDAQLTALLEHVVSELEAQHPDRKVKTRFERSGSFRCDDSRIAQLTSNLVANAMQHGDAAAAVELEVNESPEQLTIAVSNAGQPISAERLPLLFKPYGRSGLEEQRGLGLGLYIASEIARAHGGALAVTSTPERTRFVATMRGVARP